MELDLTFIRATKLLLSNSKDSEEQLRSMLEDAIKQRHPNKSLGNISVKREERSPKKDSSSKLSMHKGVDKKNYEKASVDVSPEVRVATKPKILEPVKSVTPPVAPASSPRVVTTNQARSRDDDDRGFGLEISLEDDLCCAICGGMEVGVGNHLVECLDCHTLYHQECHKPSILETDFNDPRSAWYCSSCTRETVSTTTVPKTPVKALIKPVVKHDTAQAQNLFKRNESKVGGGGLSSSKSTSSGSTATGMAGLAASLQPSSVTTSSSSGKSFGGSSTGSKNSNSRDSKSGSQPPSLGKSAAPNPNVVDKRLSIMKKKAAKQQEKRKHIK